MGRDGPVERNGLRDAASWDARRGAPRGTGGRSPGAFWELFRGEKFPAGGRQAGIARALSSNRSAFGGFGPMKASAPTTESLPGTFDGGFSRKSFGKIPPPAY